MSRFARGGVLPGRPPPLEGARRDLLVDFQVQLLGARHSVDAFLAGLGVLQGFVGDVIDGDAANLAERVDSG